MQHFPIFLAVKDRRILVAGGGECALAKLRLILKTEAKIEVYAKTVVAEVQAFADAGRLTILPRALQQGDAMGATLVYAAHDDDALDQAAATVARADGALVNIVDNLADSQFITPAIVDRDPVVVAIGTEGAAPVLARAIKADLEERLSPRLGLLAKIGKAFRHAADALPMGAKRRAFWSDYYFNAGPRALETKHAQGAQQALDALLLAHLAEAPREGHVDLVGAGPGDPELLTLKARKALDRADVVIHDRLISPEILELARREAVMLDAGKEGFGPSVTQDEIHRMMIEQAQKGLYVVRLKAGDPTVFGRLDEEIDALDAAGISWRIVPGITAASAAVAQIGQSLTKRDRNTAVRFMTGHDTKGFAEHDWRTLARTGEVAAIYMGKKTARFIQGRLIMHGADPQTPVTIVENVSRANSRVIATTLATLEQDLTAAALSGPALTFLGLAPREVDTIRHTIPQDIAL